MTLNDDLTAAIRDAISPIVAAHLANDTALADQLARTEGDLATALDRIRELETQLPPAEPSRYVYGSSFPGTTDEAFLDGRCDIARLYVPNGTTDLRRFAAFNRAYDDHGVRAFVLSVKDDTTSAFGPMLSSRPDDAEVYAVVNHEPENDGGAMTSARWKAKQAAFLPIARSEGATPAHCLMQYTLESASGRNPADWTPADGLSDLVLFDYYPPKATGQDAAVARILAYCSRFGFDRWGIGEYAVPKSASWGPAAIRTLRGLLDSMSVPAEVACYWPSRVPPTPEKPNPVDYHFTQATADAWLTPVG